MEPTGEITLVHIQAALESLYNDPNPQNKDAAQKWLIKAQRDKSAWNWCFQLLNSAYSVEVQYFGANVLHYKIANCWNEIPQEQIADLRQTLMETVFRYANGPKIVLTRTCVALAALVLHLVTGFWETAVNDIIHTLKNVEFAGASMVQKFIALLEILTVLPEELQTSRLDKARRRDVRVGLTKGAEQVLALLLQILTDASSDNCAKEKALKCLASWLVLELPPDMTTNHVAICFDFIRQPELFEVSVEGILASLNSAHTHAYPASIEAVFPKVLALDPLLNEAIKNQDQESLLGISKIVCALCEHHTRLLLAKIEPFGAQLIQMVLKITSFPLQYPTEEAASPISFSFWYSLQDEFDSMDQMRQQNWGRFIHTLFFTLVDKLVVKCKHPDMSKWSAEEKEQYRVYRIDVSDTLMYIFNLLGPGMLQFLVDILVRQCNQMPNYDWGIVESLLFCFYSIVESCDAEGDFMIPVVNILPKLDMTNQYLAETCMYTVGALAEWLTYRTEYLPVLLPIVIPGLRDQSLALTAVLTLKRITRECRFCDCFTKGTLSIELVVAMRDALHIGHLKGQESGWLVQSIGHVLSALPEDECLKQLELVIARYVMRVEQICQQQPTQQNRAALIEDISLLSHLQSTLDRAKQDDTGKVIVENQRPAALVLEKMIPLLKEVLKRYFEDAETIQVVTNFFDKSIKTMLDHATVFVTPISELLVQITPNSSPIVDLIQQIISVFSDVKQPECHKLLQCISCHLQHLTKAGGLPHNPDIVSSALDLYSNLIRKNTQFILTALPPIEGMSMIEHAGKLCHSGLYFCEPPVVKAAISLMTEASRQASLQEMITHFGQAWLLALMDNVTGNAGRQLMDFIADGLFALSKPNVTVFAQWMNFWKNERVKKYEAANGKESEAQRNHFIQSLIRERTNKRKVREICSQFSLLARGLHGVS